jgi:hypothetical protein
MSHAQAVLAHIKQMERVAAMTPKQQAQFFRLPR